MSSRQNTEQSSSDSLRAAVMAAALGVAGCFTAAATLAQEPEQAAKIQQAR